MMEKKSLSGIKCLPDFIYTPPAQCNMILCFDATSFQP
jgi:hypothetical protein